MILVFRWTGDVICSGVYKPFPFPFNASCEHHLYTKYLLASAFAHAMTTCVRRYRARRRR